MFSLLLGDFFSSTPLLFHSRFAFDSFHEWMVKLYTFFFIVSSRFFLWILGDVDRADFFLTLPLCSACKNVLFCYLLSLELRFNVLGSE